MNADQILTEIREANLSYLMLAQSLIRTDRDQALYRLGISEESAELLRVLTPVVEPAMDLLKLVWRAWRKALWQLEAPNPRIWSA